MSKRPLTLQEAFPETTRLLSGPGLLLNGTRTDGTVNTMTIGWATFGAVWGRSIAVVFVRPARYTYQFLEETPDFTINVLPEDMSRVLAYCGTKSGRDVDKFTECGLTPEPAQKIRTPAIREAVIVYECETLQRNDLCADTMVDSVAQDYYPESDYHRCYYGEIVACYGDVT